ncbi:MAG: RDD family protein, partial [Rubrivivax sp.]|nr:RDD family protein [Rubrivivax sp.]
MSLQAADDGVLCTPGLARRLACFLYEGVLLFGVVVIAGLGYGIVTQQRHALVGSTGLQAFLVLVLGLYFVHFWSRSGQTLAMLTWHIRLVTASGQPVSRLRAACRYLLSWIWFLPALAAVH